MAAKSMIERNGLCDDGLTLSRLNVSCLIVSESACGQSIGERFGKGCAGHFVSG
jgi:hypothetical protein